MKEIRILQEHVRISDPHVTSDNAERLSILGNVFEPLMRVQEDGSFKPCLATSWTLSDDARTWQFRLREDAFFHDRKALLPEDVVFSLRRMRDEDLPGELGTSGVIRAYLAGAEIETKGPNTVAVRTQEPMADLADLLCEIPILSEQSVARLPSQFVGTGPFKVVESGDRVVLEGSSGRLIWESESDPEKRLRAVQEGSAHVAAKISPRNALESGVRMERSTTSVCATFMFNFGTAAAGGLANNIHLRRAINWAIDVPTLVKEVMYGAANPLSGPLTRRHLGFDPAVASWPYNPERARAELEVGGIASGTRLTIDIPSVLPDEAPELAARVAAYLAAIGLQVDIRTDTDRPGYALRVRDGYVGDLACFDSSPSSTFRVFNEKFHSGLAGPWWMGYSNQTFDDLVDRARSQADFSLRKELYQKAYALLREEAPWLFLYNPVRLTAISSELAHWTPSTGGILLF